METQLQLILGESDQNDRPDAPPALVRPPATGRTDSAGAADGRVRSGRSAHRTRSGKTASSTGRRTPRAAAQTRLSLVQDVRSQDRSPAQPLSGAVTQRAQDDATSSADIAEARRQIALLRATLAAARGPQPLEIPRAG
ncbi:MAG: hypothetical protein KAZ88_08875 [Acidimicrobiia bacterium]|nr:hypothetical protein [Acidimicrobiia bacterium]